MGKMTQKKITFLLLSYNQSKYISICLDSIKYQILNFGKEFKFQLIIADDCSSDNTIYIVKEWLKTNSLLFDSYLIIVNRHNIGTSKNFANAFRKINGDYYISIAADDFFSNYNIIKEISELADDEIMIAPPLIFDEKGIRNKISDYNTNAFYTVLDYYDLFLVSKYACPITNGALLGRKIIDEEVLKFSENVCYLDDQARYYYIFRTKNFKIKYSNFPLIFYRKHTGQITDNKGYLYEKILSDKKKLIFLINRIEKNIIIALLNHAALLLMLNINFRFLFIHPGMWYIVYFLKLKKIFNKKKILSIADKYSKIACNNEVVLYFNSMCNKNI